MKYISDFIDKFVERCVMRENDIIEYRDCRNNIKWRGKAAAHLRRLMREKPENYFCCVFLPESGIFVYDESIDRFTVTIRNEPEFTVSCHIGKQYDCGESLREFMCDILDFMKGV